jgi:hypothetical protein
MNIVINGKSPEKVSKSEIDMARTIRLGIALLTFGVILGFIFFYKKPHSEVLISDRMSEFIDAVDRHKAKHENKVVAIDLDDTVFMSTKSLGSPTWFYNMINVIRQQGAAKYEAYTVMSKIDKFVQEKNQVVLVEQATLSAVRTWQKLNVTVVGFSSRLNNMANITDRQLHNIGLYFSSPYFSCVENIWPKGDGGFINGVLYVDDYANKARIFERFYELLTLCGMQIDLIAQADDQQRYVTKVAKFAKAQNIDFIGIIYGGALSARVFDLKEANQQLIDLEIHHNSLIIPDEYRDAFAVK